MCAANVSTGLLPSEGLRSWCCLLPLYNRSPSSLCLSHGRCAQGRQIATKQRNVLPTISARLVSETRGLGRRLSGQNACCVCVRTCVWVHRPCKVRFSSVCFQSQCFHNKMGDEGRIPLCSLPASLGCAAANDKSLCFK